MYNNYILSLILNQFMHQDKSTAQNRSIICKRMCKFDIYPNFITLHAFGFDRQIYILLITIYMHMQTLAQIEAPLFVDFV